MRFLDITKGNQFEPNVCRFNVDWGDDSSYDSGYSSGKSEGYEKAKKEFEQKMKDKEQELMARGFVPKIDESNYVPVSIKGLSGAVTTKLVPQDDVSKYADYGDVSRKIFEQSIGSELIPLTFCGDIPKQNNLPKGSKLCGYIEIDGTYHKCSSCEHERIIRQIIWENDELRQRYFNTPASFFDQMPRGMLQEEYFAMKDLGFVKISSFKNTPNDMVVFFYNNLTYKQSDIVYPR